MIFSDFFKDHNRALTQLAEYAKCKVTDIDRFVVWGNHSATQFPDISHATIKGKWATDVITDKKWLKENFVPTVQNRGAAIIKARGLSSAASAASSCVDACADVHFGTYGRWTSAGVVSDGSYGKNFFPIIFVLLLFFYFFFSSSVTMFFSFLFFFIFFLFLLLLLFPLPFIFLFFSFFFPVCSFLCLFLIFFLGITKGLFYGFPVVYNDEKQWDIVRHLPIDEAAAAAMEVTHQELLAERDAVKDFLRQ